jgi:zinc/manganese transport system ATP-binding protein
LSEAVLTLREAALSVRSRTLWRGLNLDVAAGEFVAVLGANGSGKTSLLQAILGLRPLSAGEVHVAGRPPRRGSGLIGYIPQERRMAPPAPLRARDLVRFGLDGTRWGIGRWGIGRRPARLNQRVEAALESVGAAALADRPVHLLSGGEQQRVRIAQAVATDPALLLCDEPLLSLDLAYQRTVVGLLDQRRRERGTSVLFVTHEINPVLPYADRVLYLADGRFSIGSVDEVLTSANLSSLYRTPVDVIRADGRIVVIGVPEGSAHDHEPLPDDAPARLSGASR